MRVVPDNAHCMKHACSHPLDTECPQCKVDGIVRGLMREAYPHICPVRLPELWKGMREIQS